MIESILMGIIIVWVTVAVSAYFYLSTDSTKKSIKPFRGDDTPFGG
jgi:hypothetical protein